MNVFGEEPHIISRATSINDYDREWLLAAIEESRRCRPSDTAYSVGAIVVGADGREWARGYSRETDPVAHAEEIVLTRLDGVGLAGSTLYSSLEPCTARRSRPRTCTELILATGIRRVVIAVRELPIFAHCRGVEMLAAAGVEVVELTDLADLVHEVNVHVISRGPATAH